uniref:Transmembrane protein 17B n=1 Tax=Phasianus colchicus TaxID=9054 RepID=A0A669PEJ8_PHACC
MMLIQCSGERVQWGRVLHGGDGGDRGTATTCCCPTAGDALYPWAQCLGALAVAIKALPQQLCTTRANGCLAPRITLSSCCLNSPPANPSFAASHGCTHTAAPQPAPGSDGLQWCPLHHQQDMGQQHCSPLPSRYPGEFDSCIHAVGSHGYPHPQQWLAANISAVALGLGCRGGMMGVLGILPSPAFLCPVHEVLASLPLQVMLYFNVCYFPCWCLAEGMMLQLKYNLLPRYYQLLLLAAFLILTLAEGARLYLGYIGNLQEKVRAGPVLHAGCPLCPGSESPSPPFLLECQFTESQNGEGWKGPQGSSISNPLPHAGPPTSHLIPDQAAQGPIQSGLEHLQGRGIHSLSGQLFQHLTTLSVKNFPLTSNSGCSRGFSPCRGVPHVPKFPIHLHQPLPTQVPELAGFLLLSILIQLPLLLFLLTDHLTIRLPLELAVHSLLLAFLICEVVAGFQALRAMSRQLAAQFYLRQFKVGSQGDAAGHNPPY